jgi:hypothetical protein
VERGRRGVRGVREVREEKRDEVRGKVALHARLQRVIP